MSHSIETRKENLEFALKVLASRVGEQWAAEVLFDLSSGEGGLSEILPTTWAELESRGLIESNDLDLKYLSGEGWKAGIDLLGTRSDEVFQRRLGRISAALKAAVKGRERTELMSIKDIAGQAEVSEGLVCNYIDSRICESWFRRRGAYWCGNDNGIMVEIPIGFGLPLLPNTV